MKKFITAMIAILMVVSVNISNAQSQNDGTKLSKKEQKEAQAREMKARLLDLVQDQTFVLDANALSDRYGNRINVASNNFIMLEGDRLIMQTAFPAGSGLGYNGLGGITIKGRLTDFKVNPGQGNKSISVTALFNSNVAGAGRVSLNITNDGYTNATFTDNWGNRLYFYGYLQSLDETNIYEGLSI